MISELFIFTNVALILFRDFAIYCVSSTFSNLKILRLISTSSYLYGPMAAGAFGVLIILLMIAAIVVIRIKSKEVSERSVQQNAAQRIDS